VTDAGGTDGRATDARRTDGRATDARGADARATDDGADAVLRVVRGRPDAEELAAVTAVLLLLEAEAAERPASLPAPSGAASSSAWTRSVRRGRTAGQPGAGAWRGFAG